MAAEKQKRSDIRDEARIGGLSGVQVMFATILSIGLILAINFSSRITAGQPLQQTYERVSTEIETLRREQARLIAQRDYVRSDAYVENWARDEGKMIRPGEVLVVPVPSGIAVEMVSGEGDTTVNDPLTFEGETPAPDNWLTWWALFFDSPPPEF